jgi:hypothetical protein
MTESTHTHTEETAKLLSGERLNLLRDVAYSYLDSQVELTEEMHTAMKTQVVLLDHIAVLSDLAIAMRNVVKVLAQRWTDHFKNSPRESHATVPRMCLEDAYNAYHKTQQAMGMLRAEERREMEREVREEVAAEVEQRIVEKLSKIADELPTEDAELSDGITFAVNEILGGRS